MDTVDFEVLVDDGMGGVCAHAAGANGMKVAEAEATRPPLKPPAPWFGVKGIEPWEKGILQLIQVMGGW